MDIFKKSDFNFKLPLNRCNLIGYALPVILIGILFIIDLTFIKVINIYEIVNAIKTINYYLIICVSLLFGWLIYQLEVYQLFPRYIKNKKLFRYNISKIMSYGKKEYMNSYGKYIYKILLRTINEEERKKLLIKHTTWVCFMHCFVGTYLSIFYLVYKTVSKFDLNNLLIILFNFFILIMFYLGAENKRKELNDDVYQLLLLNKENIIAKVPENIEVILNVENKSFRKIKR